MRCRVLDSFVAVASAAAAVMTLMTMSIVKMTLMAEEKMVLRILSFNQQYIYSVCRGIWGCQIVVFCCRW